MEYGKGPCVTKGLAAYDQLRSHVSPPSPELRAFERLANVTDLLDKVLVHVRDPTPHRDFNGAEAIQLMNTLTSFQSILKEESSIANEAEYSAGALCQR